MLQRSCAGGIVFHDNAVLLLKNEKAEWVFPKGIVRGSALLQDVALERVKCEAGVNARIITVAGQTNYEFYSHSRQRPVSNHIIWYVCAADDPKTLPNPDVGFVEGGFYEFEQAVNQVTYSQDRQLLELAHVKYKDYLKNASKTASEMETVHSDQDQVQDEGQDQVKDEVQGKVKDWIQEGGSP